MSNDSAKKARLLHGCNLALLGLMLCTTLLAGEQALQQPATGSIKDVELLSYEGQKVSSVELAGQPDLDTDQMMALVAMRSGEEFSVPKIQQTIAALRNTGRFKDVQLDLRPEPDGVRVMFILQPAVYFGVYQFPGAEELSYNRLLVAANYIPQEPYSAIDIHKARDSLLLFLKRNGYFEADVQPDVKVDKADGLANVEFHVTLNRRAKFGDIVIEGTTPDEAAHIKDSLRSLRARLTSSAIREGKDYSFKTLQNATQSIESHLQKENHLAAVVRLTGATYDPQTNRADVSFDVQPGPLVHAEVHGAHLWPWTKHKLLPIYQLNGLTPELVQEGRQNLLNEFRKKGYFDVQVNVDTQARPNGIIVRYDVDKGRRKKIQDVVFTGNNHFDEDELDQHIDVSTSGLLSRGKYNARSAEMLETFYRSKGFNEVKVTPRFETEDGRVIVTFAIEEGPQDTVASFRVAGNSSVPLRQLAPDGLRLGPGQPYAQQSVDEDRSKIMSYYLDHGYLTATFQANAQPLPSNPHKFEVVYNIHEGPQVKASSIVTVGNAHTKDTLIDLQSRRVEVGQPLTEREMLTLESRLYATGVFDWAEVNPRRQITSQEQEDVIIKLHETNRNTMTYGFGYEFVNKGGSIPSGTVALPGLPPFGLPSTFRTNQQTVQGPRLNFQYTRKNVRGKAETLAFGALYGPLDKRASVSFIDPNFRWSRWTATASASGEVNKENPIFDSRLAQLAFELQRPLGPNRSRTLSLRYTLTETGLTNLVIPELVPPEDRHTRLSTLAVEWVRDTRDNPIDAHTGAYDSLEFRLNPAVLGSNVNFGKLLAQAAVYKNINGMVWANSLRLGFAKSTSGSHVPISEKFFTGGGSTLRGFPLNGAGPQTTVTACGNPSDPSTCAFIQVPTGGPQLLILNSEFRFPLPVKKGLTFAAFYDGGNVFRNIGFKNFFSQYTNSVGVGVRYVTPVGPIRFDVGHNLNPIPGVKATQIFITLGQAF
jgi:outer membrane protein assembly factor BamA